MTPAALILARAGNQDATAAATTLWASIVGKVTAERAGAAPDAVNVHVGADTDVPDDTLREAVIRTGSYLQRSAALLGFHGTVAEGAPEADPRVGGYSALRRSGAMSLLTPWTVKRAGVI